MAVPRRLILGASLGVAAIGGVAAFATSQLTEESADSLPVPRPAPAGNPIIAENSHAGSDEWKIGMQGTQRADDRAMQIKAYASTTSVNRGGSLTFHVSVAEPGEYRVDIYRHGFYGGKGARLMATSPQLLGSPQSDPSIDALTGLIKCDWPEGWKLDVGKDWVSGLYLAVFTTASGWRGYTPFVVRDDQRQAELCVVIPFSTYQAYNMWPKDGRRGKSLYYGYAPGSDLLQPEQRAHKISFDRPYQNDGLPSNFDLDTCFIHWAEEQGYNLTYAATEDLHHGRLDGVGGRGLVFSGHDEYWSQEMRSHATRAVGQGISLAFMTANNVYWHVRFEDGGRTMVCYKGAADPEPGIFGTTSRWRHPTPGPASPEQALLGVMFNGILSAPVPLVVQEAEHWFWEGTGVLNGDLIENVVGGEADGIVPDVPLPAGVRQTILSSSPFVYKTNGANMLQNTSLYETQNGALVFAAASLTWPRSLAHPKFAEPRIQQATANVFRRILDRERAPHTIA